MKMKHLGIISIAAFAIHQASAATPEAPKVGVSAKTVATVIKKLGFTAEQVTDKKGNPHFVIKEKAGSEKAVAIFLDDCKAGKCEDVTFYADFGAVEKLKAETINEWNHIGSKLRSKAFRSQGIDNAAGPIGISTTVSYLDDKNQHSLGMQLGLFLTEVKMFSATISKL